MIRSITIKTILGTVLFMMSYSCAVGPNLKEHPVSTPEAYINDSLPPDSALVTDWWNLFDDPVLDSLIYVALDSNKDVRIAAQRVEQARLQARVTRGNFGPKFNIEGRAATGNYFGLPRNIQSDIFFAGGTAVWEIDFWGKYRRLNENAKSAYLSSEFGRRALEISIISEVATQYFTLLEFQRSLEIAEQTLDLRKETLEIIQARFDKGVVPEIDLNQSQIQYTIAEAAVPFYRQAVLQTMLSLNILLAQNPGPVPTGNVLDSLKLREPLPPGLPVELIARRPDIQQAWYDARAQNALVGVAQANRFPSITLSGTLGIATNDFSNFNITDPAWNVGAGLVGPLFHWNQNLRRVQIEKAGTEAAIQAYEFQVLVSMAEVEGALIDIQANENVIMANRKRTEAAMNALNLSDQRYKRGVTSYLEYLESQRQSFDAQLSLASSQAALLISYMELYRALGGGWLTPEEKEQASQDQE